MTNKPYEISKGNKTSAFVLIGVGLLSIIYGFATGHTERAWANLLLSNFYLMAIALGATFFLAVQYVAEVGWSAQIKRVLMAMGQYLPFATVFMVLIFLVGHHHLYDWTHPENYEEGGHHYDPILAGKSGYLNMTFYTIRLLVYAIIWSGFAILMRRESLREDEIGGTESYFKMRKWSAIFLVLFAVSSSTSAWDILMSIDAHWFSTLFGWYTFAGMFVSSLTVITMITLYLKGKGYLSNVNENHIHDLGKFMFAFSVFWTYLWFAQFMLIWYANLPEEVAYYIPRHGYFRPVFIANLLINFFCPFLILMTRDAKRKAGLLAFIGSIMLIGHWLDVYLMVMPGTVGEEAGFGIMEIGTTCFFTGLFLYVTFNALSKAKTLPENHPMMVESLHHHI
ncbi:MAG: quinol:cytochrome C oxidoreductase [Bacteroidota bacterium]|jgi:hypothetical protein